MLFPCWILVNLFSLMLYIMRCTNLSYQLTRIQRNHRKQRWIRKCRKTKRLWLSLIVATFTGFLETLGSLVTPSLHDSLILSQNGGLQQRVEQFEEQSVWPTVIVDLTFKSSSEKVQVNTSTLSKMEVVLWKNVRLPESNFLRPSSNVKFEVRNTSGKRDRFLGTETNR